MRIDFDQPLCDFNGVAFNFGGKPATLKSVAIAALLASYGGDPDPTGEEKARRYSIAQAIHNGTCDPSPEDTTLIKTLVGKAFQAPIVGPVYELLDGLQVETRVYVEPTG